jgi:hypothetical protein
LPFLSCFFTSIKSKSKQDEWEGLYAAAKYGGKSAQTSSKGIAATRWEGKTIAGQMFSWVACAAMATRLTAFHDLVCLAINEEHVFGQSVQLVALTTQRPPLHKVT